MAKYTQSRRTILQFSSQQHNDITILPLFTQTTDWYWP